MLNKNSKIPIKNIFYMLCYAWNVLAVADDVIVGIDDYDDAYNLLSRVFSYGVSKLIRSGFHKSYINNNEELSSLRGKINIQESINQTSFLNKKLVCDFDEYSIDDIFNQIVRYTIDSLLKNISIDKELRRDLIKQNIYFSGVKSIPPTKDVLRKISFNRNNIIYKLLINISVMLYNGTTINEDDGTNSFKDFFRDEQMHKVFELFLLNFYSIHLDNKIYKVHAPKIYWHIDDNAYDIWQGIFDVKENLGDRRTDIVIENRKKNIQLIFDAKYYQNTFTTAYLNENDRRVRVSHLNQLRGYLIDSDFDGPKYGALLYPMVNDDLSKGEVTHITDTPIIIKTINLNDDWKNIEKDLLDFVNKIEKGYSRSLS